MALVAVGHNFTVDNHLSKDVLHIPYDRNLFESLKEMIQTMIDFGVFEKKKVSGGSCEIF